MEHAVRIAAAMNRSGLWDEEDGFFYDALKLADGSAVPIKVHSMVGLIPLLPVASIPEQMVRRGQSLGKRFASFMESDAASAGERLREGGFVTGRAGHQNLQLSVVPPVRLGKLLGEMLSEDGFLSPHGLRALSKRHRDQPFKLELGGLTATVDYEPGESTSGLFGGNSNWRGPVWMPTNYLVIVSLWNWDSFMGDDFRVEYPTGSGQRRSACATWPRTSPAGWSPSGSTTRTAGGRCSGRTRSSRPTRTGTTCSGSTSTSTATPGPGSAPRTRPAGPGSWPTCSARAACIDAIDSGRSTARMGAAAEHRPQAQAKKD